MCEREVLACSPVVGKDFFFVILFNENSHGTEVTSTSIPHNVAQIVCDTCTYALSLLCMYCVSMRKYARCFLKILFISLHVSL